jgi:DNA-directed RNA polymerase sigma subunit (sigma70/sigma32)
MKYYDVDSLEKALEIYEVYEFTREWIRQIEAKVMKKLRDPARSQAVRDYLDD